MADTFSTNIKGNVRGREDIDPFEEARDLINQAAAENFRNQELARMQGSLPVIDRSPVRGSYGGGEDQLAPANVSPLTLASYGGGEKEANVPQIIPQGIASMFPDPTGGYATRGDPRESFAARDVAIE